ncbi:MAG: ABC transporter permease [Thermoprotei archaeon]
MSWRLLLETYLKFYFRTRRFLVMLPLYVFISLLTPLLMYTNTIPQPQTVNAFTAQTLGGVTDDVLLVAAVMAGDAISQDYSQQGYFTLTQPVHRLKIMLTRFTSAFLAVSAIMVSTFVIGVAFSYVLYHTTVSTLPQILGLTFLFGASLTMFIIMFSSMFRSQGLSIIVSILIVVVAMPLVQGVLMFLSHVEPWFLITYASSAVSNLALQSYPAHVTVTSELGRKVYVYQPYVFESVYIMLGYLFFSMAVAYAVYARKELNG